LNSNPHFPSALAVSGNGYSLISPDALSRCIFQTPNSPPIADEHRDPELVDVDLPGLAAGTRVLRALKGLCVWPAQIPIWAIALAALSVSTSLLAQSRTPSSGVEQTTLRVNSRAVLVDVLVTDRRIGMNCAKWLRYFPNSRIVGNLEVISVTTPLDGF